MVSAAANTLAPMAGARGAQARGTDSLEARIAAAWRALERLEDPELPPLTLMDLGIVRYVRPRSDGALEIGITPTYTGCPATDYIRQLAEGALAEAQVGPFKVSQVLAPAWSSDWITRAGRHKLESLGVVPPESAVSASQLAGATPVPCPRCGSGHTECISEFGSTPCKALHRCRECLEPFERFKCI
jgi:ring-1,2-phenylacetyl-CoA epoxidase subunit PaaD